MRCPYVYNTIEEAIDKIDSIQQMSSIINWSEDQVKNVYLDLKKDGHSTYIDGVVFIVDEDYNYHNRFALQKYHKLMKL